MMHGIWEGWEAQSELDLIMRWAEWVEVTTITGICTWERHSFSNVLVLILAGSAQNSSGEESTSEIMILSTEDSQLTIGKLKYTYISTNLILDF